MKAQTAALFVCSLLMTQMAYADQAAQDRVAGVINRYACDDTVAVAAIQVDGRWTTGLQQMIGELAGQQANQVVNHRGFAVARGFVESFRAAGAREWVVLVGLNDISPATGPVLVMTVEEPAQADALASMVQSLLRMSRDFDHLQVASHEGHVLLAQEVTLARYQQQQSGDTSRLARAAKLFDQPEANDPPVAAALVAPGETYRRVVRALWPDLPAPFTELTGKLIADDIEQVVVTFRCPPEWKVNLAIDTSSDRAATTLESLATDSWDYLLNELPKDKVPPEAFEAIRTSRELLTLTRNDHSLQVTLSHDDPRVETLLQELVLPPLQAAREAAQRNLRLNNLKQMALAMFNFESTNGNFPAATAIVDKEGRPLLSWRVAVLPFLEGQTLYNQFHFDEPWDSPHNLKLLPQMPAVYRDASHPELAAVGKTTYVVPVHPQSAFPPSDGKAVEKTTKFAGQDICLVPGTQLRDITDGTSNTLMIVQVPPEQAVPWTKPADWEVDLAKVWQQLRGNGRRQVLTAFCDGSARILDLDNEKYKQNLPKFITRNGQEVVEY